MYIVMIYVPEDGCYKPACDHSANVLDFSKPMAELVADYFSNRDHSAYIQRIVTFDLDLHVTLDKQVTF